jgi:mono/diheme cytochrome c family protein
MNRIKIFPLSLIIFLVSFFLVNCRHEIAGVDTGGGGSGGTPTQTGNCSADTVYFATEILPLINSSCATTGCHDAITHKEGIILNSYANIRAYVSPFKAGSSKLYKECVKSGGERMPPPPMPALTQAQLSKMIVWINQGALNNACSSGCDTAVFTYAAAVAPLMNTYCKGCHNPASLGGGVDLSTYAGVKSSAAGKLLGSIKHSAGISAMPKGSNKLSDCQVIQVEKWIQAGTPNN